MGWFWADSESATSATNAAASGAKCPVDHKAKASTPAVCPVKPKESKPTSELPAVCPMKKDGDNSSGVSDTLNPLNNMPSFISSSKLPGQKLDLPTDRTFSTIPRGEDEDEGVWEYPSPQQMFNAMMKKGKGDGIPEDAVESMVDVHNFLNEGAWQEILEWEKPYESLYNKAPRLAQFTGRPHDLSPRARMYLQLSKIFPKTFNTDPPFDRHDWYVLRSNGQGGWNQVRYVIDYYGGPDDEHGMPTFFLDVRPALDNVTNAKDRMAHWLKPHWDKAMGKVDE
ncbi:Cytochrome c heme lyase [Wickerhamomyces ciferrii]|uniref:Holocytochrome c-type synthase n=1 Tax=Wickerhamomyces ciferrii (strain ATCC 14091 / BCRC 22168 / CBS 111 / JCM 3599 / NBRC 0793 / NRRL Y-1031 F-60-10) TaxID=1206466 RepID=K0KLR2_WICCF|nr:Cytochrome c heme lyase [Wickerhamomyces ciferrii]CCH43157.1 Cytochrome c heme lyase [Wickerhamomyces ciferrii]